MEDIIRKKINLLVHLAKADGQFHSSERKFLEELLMSKGIQNYDFTKAEKQSSFQDAESIVDKEELLYWALQLIQVDNKIHPDEVAYCKMLAIKLRFKPEIVDQYKDKKLPSFEKFCSEIEGYKLVPQ